MILCNGQLITNRAAINISVTSDNVSIIILTAICNLYTLQYRIELKSIESDLIIFKSDPKPVGSGRGRNLTNLKISRMTTAL